MHTNFLTAWGHISDLMPWIWICQYSFLHSMVRSVTVTCVGWTCRCRLLGMNTEVSFSFCRAEDIPFISMPLSAKLTEDSYWRQSKCPIQLNVVSRKWFLTISRKHDAISGLRNGMTISVNLNICILLKRICVCCWNLKVPVCINPRGHFSVVIKI